MNVPLRATNGIPTITVDGRDMPLILLMPSEGFSTRNTPFRQRLWKVLTKHGHAPIAAVDAIAVRHMMQFDIPLAIYASACHLDRHDISAQVSTGPL